MAAYIKFDGIDGEAQDKDHKSLERPMMSFGQSMHPSRAAGNRGHPAQGRCHPR
jgi:type VI protein secretion system component Hcp